MIALNKIAAIGLRSLGAAPPLLKDPLDVSGDFRAPENFGYLADRLGDFYPATGAFGSVTIRKKPLSYRTPRIERLVADASAHLSPHSYAVFALETWRKTMTVSAN